MPRRIDPEKITAAAAELFSRKGFADTTIDEIAALAGVSPRTVFRYFPTKADIAIARGHQGLEILRQRIGSTRRAGNLVQLVFEIARAHARYLEETGFLEAIGASMEDPVLSRRRGEVLFLDYPPLLAQDFATSAGRDRPRGEDTLAARLLMLVLVEAVEARVKDEERSLADQVDAVAESFRTRTEHPPN